MLRVIPVAALRRKVPVHLLCGDVMNPNFRSSLGTRSKHWYRASLLEHNGEHVVFILLIFFMYDVSFVWDRGHHRIRTVVNSKERIHTSWRRELNKHQWFTVLFNYISKANSLNIHWDDQSAKYIFLRSSWPKSFPLLNNFLSNQSPCDCLIRLPHCNFCLNFT